MHTAFQLTTKSYKQLKQSNLQNDLLVHLIPKYI